MNTKRSEVIEAIFTAVPMNLEATQAMVASYLNNDEAELGRLVRAMWAEYIADQQWRAAIDTAPNVTGILKGATQYELTEAGKFVCSDDVCRRAGVGA